MGDLSLNKAELIRDDEEQRSAFGFDMQSTTVT